MRRKKTKSFSVETIKDHRETPEGYEYLVKWKRYSEDENLWVPARDFDTLKPITKYWKRKKKAKKHTKEPKTSDLWSRGEQCEVKDPTIQEDPTRIKEVARKIGNRHGKRGKIERSISDTPGTSGN